MPSSNALPICRIDWRPSRVLVAGIGLIGLLAAVSLPLSALPMPAAVVGIVCVLAYSAVLMRRELDREPFTLTWAGGDADAVLNFGRHTQSLTRPRLRLRGPLAGLSGEDEHGRTRHYLWWPDTLQSAARRELRLVDQVRAKAAKPATSEMNR